MRSIFSAILSLFALLANLTSPVMAQQSATHVEPGFHATTPQATLTLLVPERSLPAGEQTTVMGLEFDLQPGWKIYWHQPGAGGRPPQMDWSTAENIASLRFGWPKPMRFLTYGFLSQGYAGRVVLPLYLQRQDVQAGVVWDVLVNFYICRQVCIPDQIRLRGWLPAAGETAAALPRVDADSINQALAQTPREYSGAMRISAPVAVRGNQEHWRLQWTLEADQPLPGIDAFFAGKAADENLAEYPTFAEPLITVAADRYRATIATEVKNLAIDQPIRLYLDHAEGGQERFEYFSSPRADVQGIDWWRVLFFAVLGGAIINVMPCVLPVLVLKVFSVLRHYRFPAGERQFGRRQAGQKTSMRGSMLGVAWGIILSFAVLGVAFALIRQAGVGLYWGIQFQQPLFLSAMVFVLCLFAAQLWGWWCWHLPGWAGRLLSRLDRQVSARGGYAADFSAGVLATLLATPCSAPFIGVAIGVALFAETSSLILIFTGMGVGMALPYLVLAALPLSRLAGRTREGTPGKAGGRWMVYVQWLMGLGVFGTALWVVWLLSLAIGTSGALSILCVAVLMLLVLASRFASGTKIALYRWRLVVLLCVLGLALPESFSTPPAATPLSAGWQEFAPQEIADHLAMGKTVLVDISAGWCVTCLVNDQRVFDQPEVVAWRNSDPVVAMRGNWDQPDENIARYLRRYQRRALPFAMVYSPSAPEGLVLPELLTMPAFVRALDRIKAPAL